MRIRVHKAHVPSTNTQVVQHPEIKSPNQVKMSDVTNYWDDYLGSNQTNIYPRTGLVDNDRIFSADGTRSIRFGNHEMNSMDTTKFHLLLLLEYDEDGCAIFQFGDSIIEIETNFDERFYAMKNSYLTISVEKLNLYDENL